MEPTFCNVAHGLWMTRLDDEEAPDGYYFPIIRASGHELETEAIEALATERDVTVRAVREFTMVIADESPRRPEIAARRNLPPTRLRVRGLEPATPLPLVFLDSALEVGVCRSLTRLPAGSVFGTEQAEGECLLAVARLNDTVLASVAWGAVRAGLFGGVCCEVMTDGRDLDGWLTEGTIRRVILGSADDTCLAAARVTEAWEDEKSVWAAWSARP
jgi:hypothetical protein